MKLWLLFDVVGSFKLTKCDVTHDCQYLVGLTEEVGVIILQFDFGLWQFFCVEELPCPV